MSGFPSQKFGYSLLILRSLKLVCIGSSFPSVSLKTVSSISFTGSSLDKLFPVPFAKYTVFCSFYGLFDFWSISCEHSAKSFHDLT